jgi:RNA polymerase sigma factor (sigma-70 family)
MAELVERTIDGSDRSSNGHDSRGDLAADRIERNEDNLEFLLFIPRRISDHAGPEPEERKDPVRRLGWIGLERADDPQALAGIAGLFEELARRCLRRVLTLLAHSARELGQERAPPLLPLVDEHNLIVGCDGEYNDDVCPYGDKVVIDDDAGREADRLPAQPVPAVVDDELGGDRLPRLQSAHHAVTLAEHISRRSARTAHTSSNPHLTRRRRHSFHLMMMDAMVIPPFERFYGEHCNEVLGYLRRLLGPRAEDAWQETFLRALRAYDRLEHGRHLRAWVFTIATRVAMDELRSKTGNVLLVENIAELPGPDAPGPAYRELEHLTADLPPTERAAVVLRYGYDLAYAEIGAALGSSEEAARAAASSGVRRLRRDLERQP